MIDTTLITLNECMNDGDVIHLYHDAKCETWMAYGISAYNMFCHIAKGPCQNILYGYSDDIQMPYAKANAGVIDKLSYNILKEYDKDLVHLKVCLSESVNPENYTRWTKQIKTQL